MDIAEGARNPVRKSLQRIVVMCLFLLPTLGIFSVSLNYGFVNWDDGLYVYDNPIIKSLSLDNLFEMAGGGQSPTWHPLAWLSHALDYKLYRLNPWGHHLTNLILHGMTTFCVFLLFVMLLKLAGWKSGNEFSILMGGAFAALLFGIHPLRVESVVWIAERKGLLAGLFVLLTLIAWLSYASAGTKKLRRRWYAAALVFFILALMSKPTVVMIPVILLLLDVFPLNRFGRWENRPYLYLEKVPFFIFSFATGVLELMGEYKSGMITTLHAMDIEDRLVNAVKSLHFFIEKTFLPTQLVPFYPVSTEGSFFTVSFIGPFSVLLGITWFSIWMWKRKQFFWLVAWLYFLVTNLPVIGLVHAGQNLTADRYSYFPTLSFYMLAGIGVVWALENRVPAKFGRALQAGILPAGFIIIALLSCLTVHQTRIWGDRLVFWQYVSSAFNDRLPVANTNLGNVYLGRGMFDDAERKYKAALKINPDFTDALSDLGIVYSEVNRLDEAEAVLKRALALKPDSAPAHNNLAIVYVKKGLLEEAEAGFKTAIKIQPNLARVHNNLGGVYQKKGLLKAAEAEFETAYKINPDFETSLHNLIKLYRETTIGKSEE